MRLALINDGSLADPAAFPLLAEALKAFLQGFAADYRRDVAAQDAAVFPSVEAAPPGWVRALVQQTLTADGALAYHDRDDQGNPIIYAGYAAIPGGEIFHGAQGDGASLLGELQHEAAETEEDESANFWADLDVVDPQDPSSVSHQAAVEVEDPVQETCDTMMVNGTKCDRTNYVLAPWFNPQTPKGVKVDRMGVLGGPGLIAPGGYAIVRKTFSRDGQVFARAVRFDHYVPQRAWRAAKKAHPRSRTSRRLGQVVKIG